MANAFSYLAVLISIVLGLAIAHLLSGVARSVSRRATTIFYWPALLWILVLLILIIQLWWYDFALSKGPQWTIAGFTSTLLIPATLYFMSFLIVPESSDMRTTFYENRAWFFSLLAAVPFLGLLQQVLVEGHIHTGAYATMEGVGFALSIGALYFGSEKAQKLLAIVGVVFIVAYLWGLFFHLPLPA